MLTSVRRDIQNRSISGNKIYGGEIDWVEVLYTDKLVVPKNGTAGEGSINGEPFLIGNTEPIGDIHSKEGQFEHTEWIAYNGSRYKAKNVEIWGKDPNSNTLDRSGRVDVNDNYYLTGVRNMIRMEVVRYTDNPPIYAGSTPYDAVQAGRFSVKRYFKRGTTSSVETEIFKVEYDPWGGGGTAKLYDREGYLGHAFGVSIDEYTGGWYNLVRYDSDDEELKVTQHTMNFEDSYNKHGTSFRMFARRGTTDLTNWADHYIDINTRYARGNIYIHDEDEAGNRRAALTIEGNTIKTYDPESQLNWLTIGQGVVGKNGFFTLKGQDSSNAWKTVCETFIVSNTDSVGSETQYHSVEKNTSTSKLVVDIGATPNGFIDVYDKFGYKKFSVTSIGGISGDLGVVTSDAFYGLGSIPMFGISSGEMFLRNPGNSNDVFHYLSSELISGSRSPKYTMTGHYGQTVKMYIDGYSSSAKSVIEADRFLGTFEGDLLTTSVIFGEGSTYFENFHNAEASTIRMNAYNNQTLIKSSAYYTGSGWSGKFEVNTFDGSTIDKIMDIVPETDLQSGITTHYYNDSPYSIISYASGFQGNVHQDLGRSKFKLYVDSSSGRLDIKDSDGTLAFLRGVSGGTTSAYGQLIIYGKHGTSTPKESVKAYAHSYGGRIELKNTTGSTKVSIGVDGSGRGYVDASWYGNVNASSVDTTTLSTTNYSSSDEYSDSGTITLAYSIDDGDIQYENIGTWYIRGVKSDFTLTLDFHFEWNTTGLKKISIHRTILRGMTTSISRYKYVISPWVPSMGGSSTGKYISYVATSGGSTVRAGNIITSIGTNTETISGSNSTRMCFHHNGDGFTNVDEFIFHSGSPAGSFIWGNIEGWTDRDWREQSIGRDVTNISVKVIS